MAKSDNSPILLCLHYVISHPVFHQRIKCFLMIAEAIPDIVSKVKNSLQGTEDSVSLNLKCFLLLQ